MANSTATITSALSGRTRALAIPAWTPIVLAAVRIGAALLFMQHGVQKLFGLLGGVGGSGATVELFSLYGLAGVLEFFGGALIALGLLTRPVAIVLALEMIAAYFIAHAPQGGFPIQNGGELALLYALVFAFLATGGPGLFSLDARSLRKQEEQAPTAGQRR